MHFNTPLPDDWCFTHQRREPTTPTTYRVCGECWHVFETEQELVDAANRWDLPPGEQPFTAGEIIFACPECGHDF